MLRWFFPKITWAKEQENTLLYQAQNRQILKAYCNLLLPRWVTTGIITNIWLYLRITVMHQINLWDINIAWLVLFISASMAILLFFTRFFLNKMYNDEDLAIEFLSKEKQE
jgi:hypothetical protein